MSYHCKEGIARIIPPLDVGTAVTKWLPRRAGQTQPRAERARLETALGRNLCSPTDAAFSLALLATLSGKGKAVQQPKPQRRAGAACTCLVPVSELGLSCSRETSVRATPRVQRRAGRAHAARSGAHWLLRVRWPFGQGCYGGLYIQQGAYCCQANPPSGAWLAELVSPSAGAAAGCSYLSGPSVWGFTDRAVHKISDIDGSF